MRGQRQSGLSGDIQQSWHTGFHFLPSFLTQVTTLQSSNPYPMTCRHLLASMLLKLWRGGGGTGEPLVGIPSKVPKSSAEREKREDWTAREGGRCFFNTQNLLPSFCRIKTIHFWDQKHFSGDQDRLQESFFIYLKERKQKNKLFVPLQCVCSWLLFGGTEL